MTKKSIFQNKSIMILTAIFCCILWGTAFPSIKTLYSLIITDNVYQIIMIAGIRFSIAGILVLAFMKFFLKSSLSIKPSNISLILLIAVLQTVLTYAFYYVGLASTTGVNASIITSSSIFIVAILTHFFFKDFNLTKLNIIGLTIGFIGIFALNIEDLFNSKASFDFQGDSLIFLSSSVIAISTILIKKHSSKMNLVKLSGYQFISGGIILIIISYLGCPDMIKISPIAWILLIYTSAISATAFSLWYILLKYYDAPKVTLYKFSIPIFGSIFSIMFLPSESFNITLLISLFLVVAGIIIFNITRNPKR